MFDISLKDMKKDVPLWVTPNAKEIKDLISRGQPVLKALKKNGYDSITGYQGLNPDDMLKRVMVQVKSVYDAITSLKLQYVSDTDSMGNCMTYNYQRVKLPRKVLEEGSGNCIELSCLFASVFEAMSLHPVIIFPPGHAMVGVLVSSGKLPGIDSGHSFDEDFLVDLGLKDCGNGESDRMQAIFLESTLVCKGHPFETAVSAARRTISENSKRIFQNEQYSVIPYIRHFSGERPVNW